MKRRRLSFGRNLQFEQLENRALLSVNVVSGGDLDITGNGASDLIQVSQTGPTTWKVQGIGATKVNGASSYTASGVTGSIRIALGDGNNSVTLSNGTVPADLSIINGDGNDVYSISTSEPTAMR
jgi:hypothetical protein